MEKGQNTPAKERRTVKRAERALSPWVRLVERTVAMEGAADAVFHSLAQTDYVCVVALTPGHDLICVRQYRPAVDALTLELPAGMLGADEKPVDCAVRELTEETGFLPAAAPMLLGCFYPDTGRLENRLWAFVAREVVPVTHFVAEPEVARVLVPVAEVSQLIAGGRFIHAMHIAALSLAVLRGAVPAFGPLPWPALESQA